MINKSDAASKPAVLTPHRVVAPPAETLYMHANIPIGIIGRCQARIRFLQVKSRLRQCVGTLNRSIQCPSWNSAKTQNHSQPAKRRVQRLLGGHLLSLNTMLRRSLGGDILAERDVRAVRTASTAPSSPPCPVLDIIDPRSNSREAVDPAWHAADS